MNTHAASIAQASLWFLRQVMPYKSPYNIAVRFRLSGELDANAVVEALCEILRRHESCRTTFAVVDGSVVQIIHADLPADVSIVDFSATADPEGQTMRLEYSLASEAFDLEKGPLLRARVLRLGPRGHSLVVVVDHIVADGMSLGVIWRELEALYPTMRAGAPSPLPPPAKQFLACVEAQNQWLQTPAFARQLEFWKNHLAGAAPCDLPTDRHRPAIKSFRGNMIHSRIPRALCDRIRALAATENASVFTVMLAVLEILLKRLSGESDITMLIPVACRNRFNAEEVIGYFANVIVLRNDVRDDLAFHDLLKNVRTEVMAGLLRQDVPFEQVIEKIRPERSLSHDPLASVGFSFLPAKGSKLELPGVDATYGEISNGGSKFDLHFFVAEVAGELSFTAEYNTDIFDQTTIERFLEHNLVLLEAVAADPGATVAALPILSPAERRLLLVDCNATAAEYPRATVVDHVRTTVARVPDRVAATFEATSLNYGELERLSNQVARCLIARGAAPGALVGIAVERSLGMLVGLLGILKTGAAYVPLDPAYPRERLAFMAEDSGLRGLVTEESLSGLIPCVNVLRLDVDAGEIDAQSGAPLDFALDPDSIAYVIYTSGSTGKPKGVQIPHRALFNFLVTMAERPGLSESDRLLAVTSLSFDIAGLELWLPLMVGAHVEIAGRETAIDGAALRARVESGQVTVLQATPSTFRLMIEAGWTRSPNLKILVGGEATSRELADQLLDRAAAVWNMYGPTETTVWSTIHPLRKGQPILIGRPIANTHIYVLDGHLQPRPIGAVGEIFIGGDGVAVGYLNRPKLTEERFIANPFGPGRIYRTGDLGRFHPDGTIEYLGRNDFQVKLRGYRIELGEVEATIASHPAVRHAVVVAQEVAPGDQRLVAYLTGREPPPSADDLRAHVRSRLPEYMVPTLFIVLDALPLTANNKIDRKALPAPDKQSAFVEALPASDTNHFRSHHGHAEPRNSVEVALVHAWRDVFSGLNICIYDNFFDLGGHSLLAIRLSAKIEAELGVVVPLVALIESPTIAQLASRIDERQFHCDVGPLVKLEASGVKPPLFLIPGIGGHVLGLRDLARVIGQDRPVLGLQPCGLDGKAPPHKSIEEMATYFIDAIRKQVPNGPYFLAGFCAGGIVAFEMALQLKRAGQFVALVALIDSYGPGYPKRGPFVFRLKMRVKELAQLDSLSALTYLRHRLAKIFERISPKRATLPSALPDEGSLSSVIRNVTNTWKSAILSYKPQVYCGRIEIFRAENQLNWMGFDYSDPAMGWTPYAQGGVRTCQVAGDHLGVVNDHVASLSAALRIALENSALA